MPSIRSLRSPRVKQIPSHPPLHPPFHLCSRMSDECSWSAYTRLESGRSSNGSIDCAELLRAADYLTNFARVCCCVRLTSTIRSPLGCQILRICFLVRFEGRECLGLFSSTLRGACLLCQGGKSVSIER